VTAQVATVTLFTLAGFAVLLMLGMGAGDHHGESLSASAALAYNQSCRGTIGRKPSCLCPEPKI
jgi:hypothetical protein